MGFHDITVYCDRPDSRHPADRTPAPGHAPRESDPLLVEQIANLLPLKGHAYGATVVIVKLPSGWKIDSDGKMLCPHHDTQALANSA